MKCQSVIELQINQLDKVIYCRGGSIGIEFKNKYTLVGCDDCDLLFRCEVLIERERAAAYD
jgi:hypothetical protein